ncbi:MAG: NAD(P)/FAD-dependent oxidoreductase [Gammaproteobacteria bacterium]|nr:NAD(P)/FAD-dependent oxidoreductase [Gammaproteobacteria bacterium]
MTELLRRIDASDDEIAAALRHAHLPSLANSLIHLTGDRALLKTIVPTPMTLGNTPKPFPPEGEEQLRDLALQTLIKGRDHGFKPQPIDQSFLLDMMNFITGVELKDDYIPYALSELDIAPTQETDPLKPEHVGDFHVAIVGGGMSGLLAAIKMQELGVKFTIYEKNEEVGGTWFENRYPGCRVDSPNHVYSYSFKKKDWPQHFSNQPTLLGYFQETADEYGLRTHTRFQSEVTEMRFDTSSKTWQIEGNGPNGLFKDTANVVIAATGQLNRPKMPDLPGIDDFAGSWFHSANWDYDVSLKGKRVGIIGTGASAFQFTPEVVKEAKQVKVFLRTPPWVALNPVYHEYISDESHWLLNNVPFYQAWFRFHMFWTSGEGLLGQARCEAAWNDKEHSVSSGNERLREVLTKGLEHQLAGRDDLIAKLTPWYPPTAKRMLIDNGHWYRSLKEEHVQVIDERISQINQAGLQLESGEQHDFDVIIYGTGFSASKFLFPMKIYGRDGNELREHWGEDPRAYLGVTTPNCPNLFFLYGPNTNLVVNSSIIFFSECEMRYITNCLRHLLENDYSSMECKTEPFEAYNEFIDDANRNMAWGASNVNAWYKNKHGRVTQCWPGTSLEFWQQLREIDPSDYIFTRGDALVQDGVVGTAGFEPATT